MVLSNGGGAELEVMSFRREVGEEGDGGEELWVGGAVEGELEVMSFRREGVEANAALFVLL